MTNTQDLSEFGYVELEEARRLFSHLNDLDERPEGLKLEFNPNSGNVFLVDNDYRCYMMNGDKLEEFFSCGECGAEGFLDEFETEKSKCKGCREVRKYNKKD